MSFTIKTNSQALFGANGEFFIQAKLSYSKDPKNKKFTVTVDGIRAYCKYGWNFKTYLTVRLATDSSGNNGKTDTGELAASGSNTYKGYIPSSGYNTSTISLSKTYNYNSDGSVPNVYLYIRGYNNSVKYLSAGKYVTVESKINTNIKSKIDELDVSAPTFTLKKSTESVGVIGFTTSTTNSYKVNLWQVGIDSKTAQYEYKNNLTGITKTYNKNGAYTIYVRARNDYNNVWSSWKSVECDSRKPNISNFTLTPTAINKAKISFTSSYKCYWKLTGTNIDSGWKGPLSANTNPNTNITVRNNINANYTLHLKRVYNDNLTNSASKYCNTILPVITIDKITTTGNQMKIEASSNTVCKNWTLKLETNDSTIVENTFAEFNNLNKVTIIANNLQMNVPYVVTIKATNVDNDLENSTTNWNIICYGCVRLGNGTGEAKLAAVHIYDINKKAWIGAVPYIYDDDMKQWRQCT